MYFFYNADSLYLNYSTGCRVYMGSSTSANTPLYLYGSLCACPANYNPACFKSQVGSGSWDSNCTGSTIWHTNHNYWYKLTNCGKSGYWICSDACANQYWRVRNTSGDMVTGMMLGCAGDFCACICAKSPTLCSTKCIHMDLGNAYFDGGSCNGAHDATVYITAYNNNDWGIIVNKNADSASEYGLDLRMGATSTAAMYARFNNAIKYKLQYNCLCHDTLIQSPIVCGATCVKGDVLETSVSIGRWC